MLLFSGKPINNFKSFCIFEKFVFLPNVIIKYLYVKNRIHFESAMCFNLSKTSSQ